MVFVSAFICLNSIYKSLGLSYLLSRKKETNRNKKEILTMKDFKIEIRETLAREISVKADSYEEALEKVKNDYFDEEIVLYGDDFSRVEFVEA